MKKLTIALIALLTMFSAAAKVIKITQDDGTKRVITSSEIASLDFNEDGTVVITAYDGEQIIATTDLISEVTVGEKEEIVGEQERTLTFTYSGTDYFSRDMHEISYVYPTTDPFGEPISMSGIILIPSNIWNGEDESEGILLFNHYTIFDANEAPTKGYATLEGMFMANPLNLNYIVVESDFYGFGATVRFPQAYIQGDVNGVASCDGLLAARRILEEMGIDYGDLTFNVGYSSGGFDALSTQKARDNYFSDEISFDKTFAGGSPSDITECYRQYVLIDSTAYNAVPPLLMVSTNATQGMGLTYEDVFQPFLAEKIDEWVMSKKYWSWPVCDSIGREKKIHEILTAPYCDLNSPESQAIQAVFDRLGVAANWTPDPTQNIYVMHSRGDDYVPVQSARPLVRFLQENGFKASVVPGLTNLQTNYLVTDMGHLTATLVYLVQTVSALKAWPTMYTDGKLNPIYNFIITQSQADPMFTLRYLDALGFDCRGVANAIIERLNEAGVEPDPAAIAAALEAVCAQFGLTVNDVNEMCYDSGIDLQQLVMDLIEYYSEYNADDEAPAQAAAATKLQTPADEYEQTFYKWLDSKGIAR